MTAEHDKRREWWIGFAAWAPAGRLLLYDQDDIRPEGAFHVREVRLGEVTITKEQLFQAMAYARDFAKDPYHFDDLTAQQLGLLPEGQEVGK